MPTPQENPSYFCSCNWHPLICQLVFVSTTWKMLLFFKHLLMTQMENPMTHSQPPSSPKFFISQDGAPKPPHSWFTSSFIIQTELLQHLTNTNISPADLLFYIVLHFWNYQPISKFSLFWGHFIYKNSHSPETSICFKKSTDLVD